MSNSTYRTWLNMRARCRRGYAELCPAWERFETFLADMGERPEGRSLDRKDGTKGYEPGNCRWATRVEQNNNKRNNRRITYKGETKTATQWGREIGISGDTIASRIKKGWPIELAFTTPPRFFNAGNRRDNRPHPASKRPRDFP
jgi:hypothetical protein